MKSKKVNKKNGLLAVAKVDSISDNQSVKKNNKNTKIVKNTATKQPNPIKNNKPFPKGVSGNPNGRPRKLVGTIIEEMKALGITPLKQSQVMDAFEMLFQLTIPEIQTYIANAETPVFVRIIGKAMLGGKGDEMLEKMLDRAHGKARQSVGVVVEDKKGPDLSGLSFEQLYKLKYDKSPAK